MQARSGAGNVERTDSSRRSDVPMLCGVISPLVRSTSTGSRVGRSVGRMSRAERDALRALVEEGNDEAADRLAELSADDEDVDTLKHLIDFGNEKAGDLLAALAAGKQDVETLNYLIDSGNQAAADRLAEIAAERGDVHTLQRLADEGSKTAEVLLSRVIRTIE